MADQPNFSESIDLWGLNVWDQQREASMADEGGVSGAIMENQDGLKAEDWMRENQPLKGERSKQAA